MIASHNYWVATVWPDGRPHVMPDWGLWKDDSAWFSSGVRSRKSRNLRADARCVVTTDDAMEPVVVEGVAEVVRDVGAIEQMVSLVNEKYSSDLTLEFLNPDVNATFRVEPQWVFAVDDEAFTDTPTRWQF